MKMPPGPGTWPAFWLAALKPVAGSDGNVEVDVIEYYGQFTSAYRTALHIWYKDTAKTRANGDKITVPDGSLVQDFHTYGVDVSPQAIAFFFDGKPVWSQPTPPELDGPLYPLVNLALGSGWPIDKTPNPSVLLVDYVHVYGRGAGPQMAARPGYLRHLTDGLPPAASRKLNDRKFREVAELTRWQPDQAPKWLKLPVRGFQQEAVDESSHHPLLACRNEGVERRSSKRYARCIRRPISSPMFTFRKWCPTEFGSTGSFRPL